MARLTASQAVDRANSGRVVVASSRPNLGYIAIVRPGSSGSNVRIAQAGTYNNKDTSAAQGFGQYTPSYEVEAKKVGASRKDKTHFSMKY